VTVTSIQERELLVAEIEDFLCREPGRAYFPVDLVSEFEKRGQRESVILSAIWRLIDDHRIGFNNRLEVEAGMVVQSRT
jgi:hypothetical protein